MTDSIKAPDPTAQPKLAGTAKLWHSWRMGALYFSLSLFYLELMLHLFVYKSMTLRMVYPLLFSVVLGSLLALLCAVLPKKANRIVSIVLLSCTCLYFEIQLVYHAIFGGFMPVSSMGMGGGVVTNFGGQILYGIGQNIVPILLLLVPLPLGIVLLVRGMLPMERSRWKQTLSSLGLSAGALAAALLLMLATSSQTFSTLSIFTSSSTSTDTSIKNLGVTATAEQELRYMAFGMEETGSLVSLGGASGGHYNAQDYNVMNIDFQSLADSTDDATLKELDEYFSTAEPTKKNQYTGILEGYNLITICAESYCPYFVSEELTPTLYKLSHNGFVFQNYYGTFPNVTTNGEYTMNMGLFPDMTRSKTVSSFDVSSNNYVPFCLGNEFRGMGAETWAYHNYIGDFYNRNITHTNMGYTFKAADSGLNVKIDWPSSDLEMMESSVDDYISSGSQFCAYYMTFSGHYQYNWENAMSAKNKDKVQGLRYSEPVKAYIACNLELEYGLEYLMDRLEEAGIADKTVIVLTNDHYPYGLTDAEYNELAGQTIDPTFEKYRNSFICYAPGLPENVYVDEYCSTEDILPTLLNLFGIPYDSRLLAGTDVLSDGSHMAILADQSFITKAFRFDASTESLTVTLDGAQVSDDELQTYRLYVQNKFQMSTDILNNNYYGHVFSVDGGESTVEDTVQFTDISNIFNQASVLYMYRNGYVDPETETTFGGSERAELGEFVDVLYRISQKPQASPSALPANVGNTFTASSPYYEAMCWAWETGLLREADARTDYFARVDYKTAATLIYRYAALQDVDTSIKEPALCSELELENQRLTQEQVEALVWLDQENITAKDSTLSEMLDSSYMSLTRYQMTSFLFYLCTYELNLGG